MSFELPTEEFPPTPHPARPTFVDFEAVRASIEKQAASFETAQTELQQAPGVAQMARSLAGSLHRWAQHGFNGVSDEVLEARLSACKTCEFWDAKSFNNTGRCTKCGCSTWAKLRMATERCPVGKWEAAINSLPEKK